jgi:hypothetical protein
MPSGIYLRNEKHRAQAREQVRKAGLNTRFRKGERTQHKHGVGAYRKDSPDHHPLYQAWTAMMTRCYGAQNYKNYGALGITVYEPWKNPPTFIFTILSLLGERPEGFSLDRINPWDGYFPWNVRWVDRKTQNLNTRKRVPDYLSQSGEH